MKRFFNISGIFDEVRNEFGDGELTIRLSGKDDQDIISFDETGSGYSEGSLIRSGVEFNFPLSGETIEEVSKEFTRYKKLIDTSVKGWTFK